MKGKKVSGIAWLIILSMLMQILPSNTIVTKAEKLPAENYITAIGDKLMNGEEEFRFASLNYPQALTDNDWEQENAIKTIAAMGGNVTRTYTIPVYNGTNESTAYVKGVDKDGKLIFNDLVLERLDHLLALCNEYDIRLIIPLVDHWHWVGGMDGYVMMATDQVYKTDSFQEKSWEFYSSETCMSYFKQMLEHLMERENTITGIKYKDDKAVLCWETGNELGAYDQEKYDDILINWTNKVTDYLKNDLKVKQLILDGRMSLTAASASEQNHADILGCHYYTGNFVTKCSSDTALAKQVNKPFILGEFGTYTKAEPCEKVFQTGYEAGANGIMMWSLRAHKDGYGYYWHDENPGDWAAYHWPGFASGDYYDESNILRVVYKYAQLMNGENGSHKIPAPDQNEAPLLYNITSVADIKWRGTVGGVWYEIQRTEDTIPDENSIWVTIAGENEKVNDCGRIGIAGFHDISAITGKGYTYRLRACNESGSGKWSNYCTVDAASHQIVDELDLIAPSKTEQNPTEKRNVYSRGHSTVLTASGGILKNSSDKNGYILYTAGIPIKNITVTMKANTSEMAELYSSIDGIHYTKVSAVTNGSDKTADLTGSYYVKVLLAGKNKCQVDKISLLYENDGIKSPIQLQPFVYSELVQDDDFSDTSPNYVYKSDKLIRKELEGYQGLVTMDSEVGTIIYKTYTDLTSFRVKVFAKDSSNVNVSYSDAGIDYLSVEPNEKRVLSDGWTQLVFENCSLVDYARFLKIDLSEDVIVSQVGFASGDKRITVTNNAPVNILEDGEYYFGNSESIASQYQKSIKNGEMFLRKKLDHLDLSANDVMYIWLTGDASNNKMVVQLKDVYGHIWEAEEELNQVSGLRKLILADYSRGNKVDFSDIVEFSMGVRKQSENVSSGIFYVDSVSMGNLTKVDDYEDYSGTEALLNAAYKRNLSGGNLVLSLDTSIKKEGTYGLKVQYSYDGTGYAGVTKNLDSLNLSEYDGIRLWYVPDGSGNSVTLQLKTSDGLTWEAIGKMDAKNAVQVYIPFEEFIPPSWDSRTGSLDKTKDIIEFSIYTNKVGEATNGIFYLDDIRGFNFKQDIENADVNITNMEGITEINRFPFEIQGTAEYVDYINLQIGDKNINIPVDENKQWKYMLNKETGIYNTDSLDIKAAILKMSGEVIKEDSVTVPLKVEGNDYIPEVEPHNYVQNWDFSSLNASGLPENWILTETGANFKMENGYLLCWSQDEYEIYASQNISNLPGGIYEVASMIKAKSNLQDARIIVKQNGEILKQTNILDTEDANVKVILEDIELKKGDVQLLFYAKSIAQDDGATFAFSMPKFYAISENESSTPINYITNGDMKEIETDWPNYPKNWVLHHSGGDGWSPIKGEEEKLVGYADNSYSFDMNQTVTDIPNGQYTFVADVALNDDTTFESFGASVESGTAKTACEYALGDFPKQNFKLEHVVVENNTAIVKISVVNAKKAIKIDNVRLIPEEVLSEEVKVVTASVFNSPLYNSEVDKQLLSYSAFSTDVSSQGVIEISLDEKQKYAGNYGIKIKYEFSPIDEQKTIWVPWNPSSGIVPWEPFTPSVEPSKPVEEKKLNKEVPVKGKKYKVGHAYYVVTNANQNGKGKVRYIKPISKNEVYVKIPDTVKINGITFRVTTINRYAFRNMKKLKTVRIGKNISIIGRSSFRGCSRLTKIVIGSTLVKKTGTNVLLGIHSKAVIYVPKKRIKTYTNLLKKQGQKKTVKIKSTKG